MHRSSALSTSRDPGAGVVTPDRLREPRSRERDKYLAVSDTRVLMTDGRKCARV